MNKMSFIALPFAKRWPVLSGGLVGLLLRYVFFGEAGRPYAAMMGSFIYLVPLLVGAVTVYLAERRQRCSWSYYFLAASAANMLLVLGSLVMLIEGLICAVVILPLFGLLGGLAGLAMGAICRLTRWPRHTLYSLTVLPLLLGGIEQHLPLPNHIGQVSHTVLIAASPAQVWSQLLDARDIEPDEIEGAWMYKIGVPLPVSGITEATVEGQVRHVVMGKQIHFDQLATDWQPQRRVRWIYRFKNDSFPPGALDDHVMIGGHYFDIQDTEYTLVPRGAATELSITMRYRVSTSFNWYAQPIATLLIGNFEQVILRFYARRAERLPTGGAKTGPEANQRACSDAASPNIDRPNASATSIPSTPADMMPPA